jgi:hypothetical protein
VVSKQLGGKAIPSLKNVSSMFANEGSQRERRSFHNVNKSAKASVSLVSGECVVPSKHITTVSTHRLTPSARRDAEGLKVLLLRLEVGFVSHSFGISDRTLSRSRLGAGASLRLPPAESCRRSSSSATG